ncbi:MAG: thiamine pyrophosphate-binding protein [Sneathiella sp.]|jgi:acetolactate synthase-1/2/3 large subunit|uniref:thiamine pyrophosphate-binding protein n=1 Tax=Sneathiella sp. TaxID=1964365 RepID=UPI000C3D2C73|nr:thiamine pyrophosphate-binding protein [Sneathiella sp.]MAL79316.1 thiamine pyrophosphate-binding protein [Sneathiella sp.]
MSESLKVRAGGHILADQLALQGVDTVFCVPGESYLAVIDGLYNHANRIRMINTRHEGGAANMAEAYGKLTGRPGICMVTRGPGATNASIGLHTAFQDSTPMILFVGQVGRDAIDREAFQEMDYRRVFGEMAKWVAEIDDVRRIPEYISRAFHTALSGRPGPVVLALPEDMLTESVAVADIAHPATAPSIAPAAADMMALEARLAAAERPFMIVGGATWTEAAVKDIEEFAAAHGIPVGASLRSQDCFDNRHPNYAGDVGIAINPKLAQRIRESDLLIVAGPRLGEMTTQGYTLIEVPNPAMSLVHVHPGVSELGRVYLPDIAINARMPEFAAAARGLTGGRAESRASWVAAAREDYLERIRPTDVPGPVNLGKIVAWLNETLPEDAIITAGAGNYAVWAHRFFQHKKFRTQLAPTSGAMGYSVPAAISAKLTEPGRTVVSFNGDGCFMMLGQELATAMQFDAAVIFIIVNNGMLGTIRMHQERGYPERVHATTLANPDFAALARAYGAFGEKVTRTEDFAGVFKAAQAAGKAAVIELIVDSEALTPEQSLAAVRAQGKMAKAD